MIKTVLLGHLTPVNKTVLQFLKDDENIQIQHLAFESVEELRSLCGSVDVLIIDLKSFGQNPLKLIRRLKELGKFKSIIVLNSLSSWRSAELLLDAGANGYLTHDTNEEEIIEAITTTNRGESFVRF